MRSFAFFAPALLLSLTACSGPSGNGKDGGNPDEPVDPSTLDDDGDGLTAAEEDDLGTDPDRADTDGDGWNDKEELDAETDPLDGFSWVYGTDRWPDFSDEAAADGVDGDTYGERDVFPNFTSTDQFGNDVSLYQFYGYVILVDFSAGWCGPCRTTAAQAEDMWEDYREEGFVIIHAMVDNNQGNGNVNQTFLESWVEDYDLEFPVLNAGPGTEPNDAQTELYYAGLNQGYIPYMILLNQSMKLVEIYEGSGQEATISAKVEQLLGR